MDINPKIQLFHVMEKFIQDTIIEHQKDLGICAIVKTYSGVMAYNKNGGGLLVEYTNGTIRLSSMPNGRLKTHKIKIEDPQMEEKMLIYAKEQLITAEKF